MEPVQAPPPVQAEAEADPQETPKEEPAEPMKPESPPPEVDADRELAELREAWPDIVEKCLVIQPLLRRDLRDSWPLRISERTLVIGFDPEFSGEMEEVMQLDHGGLHHFFSEKLGRSVRIDYEVMKEAVTWSHHAPSDGTRGSGSGCRNRCERREDAPGLAFERKPSGRF